MGLCKCPKKKVTNLFCFEHRVNVCEHCLVANHNKCVVQSYLQWLQDSDFTPNCSLCTKDFTDESCGECVRLSCYDLFHFSCLNQYALQLPRNTAPAGYTCPTCKACIFPPSNMVSPVVESLREVLAKMNWARAGLGLPMIEEAEPTSQPAQRSVTPKQNGGINHTFPASEPSLSPTNVGLTNLSTLGASPAPNMTRPISQVTPYSTPASKKAGDGSTIHSVINVDAGTSARGQEKSSISDPRKLFDSTKEDIFNLSADHDDDKYKRRPAMDWLNRWIRSRDTTNKRGMKKDPMSMQKRFLIVLLLGVIGFITVVVIFSKLGRNATEDDPFFDPMANPNVRVNES